MDAHFSALLRLQVGQTISLNTHPVVLKLDTQTWIVFLSGTGSRQPSCNRMWNIRWVVIADLPLRINSSMTNAQCLLVHTIASTKNGTYIAIEQYHLHHCITTTTTTAPSLNTGGLFTGPYINYIYNYSNNFLKKYVVLKLNVILKCIFRKLLLISSPLYNVPIYILIYKGYPKSKVWYSYYYWYRNLTGLDIFYILPCTINKLSLV